jgi:tRNA modification GTPase
MSYDVQDTIAAIATPPAGAARGVVRFSGPAALSIAERLFRPTADQPALATLRVPTALSGQMLLEEPLGPVAAELLVWPTARSYTRQVTVEVHTFGSPPILDAVLAGLIAAGARLAQPGEFTLRAFLAGRLDLTQAEAVLGVIDAQDRRSLDTALGQLAGGLAGPLAAIRGGLLDLLAHLEAGLDFVEEDIEFISAAQLQAELGQAARQIAELAAQMQSRDTAEAICKVVIVGWPNVGKSSLLNALAEAEAALVSPVAGATRDYVARRIEADGVAYELIDTAGVCAAAPQDGIDRSAQVMTQQQIEQADLQLLCLDATREPNAWEREQLDRDLEERLIVLTKADVVEDAILGQPDAQASQWLRVSSVTGAGLAGLRAAILARLSTHDAETSVVSGTAARCRESLARAAEALTLATAASRQGYGEELVAAELRLALEEIGKVAGVVYTDDVLDRIFSRFCIGK